MILDISRTDDLVNNQKLCGLLGIEISQRDCDFYKSSMTYFTIRYPEDSISFSYINIKNQKFFPNSFTIILILPENKKIIKFKNISCPNELSNIKNNLYANKILGNNLKTK